MVSKRLFATVVLPGVLGVSSIASLFGPIPTPIAAAQQSQQRLAGSGIFTLRRQPTAQITSVVYEAGADAERTFIFNLDDGRHISLSGTPDAVNAGRFQVTSSNVADASGSLQITYSDGNPTLIEGNGSLGGRRFTVSFTRSSEGSPETSADQAPLQLTRPGSGLYKLGDRSRNIMRASVVIRTDGKAEILFRLVNNRRMQFQGQVTERHPYWVTVSLNSFGKGGKTAAMGTAHITLSSRTSIQSIVMDGTVEEQRLLANFLGR